MQFRFRTDNGHTPTSISAQIYYENNSNESKTFVNTIENFTHQEKIKFIHFLLDEFGYWDTCVSYPASDCDIEFKLLPKTGPLGWWHEIHGITQSDLNRGNGIRIGVIDQCLPLLNNHSCIGHVQNIGASPWGLNNDPNAYSMDSCHGLAICSLLASRIDDANGYQGIVPGADLIFASAYSDTSDSAISSDNLASCIEALAEHYRCDIITISAGDYSRPLFGVQAAIRSANDFGCLCFFAAGNTGGKVLYPAKFDESLAVASCGYTGFAPKNSSVAYYEKQSKSRLFNDLYGWILSAYGDGVNYMAAGSGTIWNFDGNAAYAVNGTSYASPIAAGVAAIILSKDSHYRSMKSNKKRCDYAIQLINRHCNQQVNSLYSGNGIIKV